MPWRWGNHLMLGRIVQRMTSKQLCPRSGFLVEFLVSSEFVDLSPLRKSKHSHGRCWSCTTTTLEMTTDLFCQLPRWIDEHTLSSQVSLQDEATPRTVRKVTVRVKTLVISTILQGEVKSCVQRLENIVNHFPIN
jgi:hypothetical protein